MIRRARLLSVVAILLGGALGLISSTQTWIHVALTDGASADLTVAGAGAIPVLAPLSLAVLALGLALSIVGPVLRYVFGVISILAGGALIWAITAILLGPPVSAMAAAVTQATGIAGGTAVAALVGGTTLTAWPAVALLSFVLVTAAGAFVIATARRWQRGGRRYEAARAARRDVTAGPLDAIDSWDDLSRGDDPTTTGTAR
ncbi:Trp biosynthesis-associated membrane protein [Microbacterium sp. SORGH_AS_0888]|uniref:Trp biosynthesis-associated membrane protein n=1 Tax=Microbacterium sp. SORGH_AS_0888 TaxID=3041791 RepID=UPI00278AE10E|nr:Trp biosynthesis-associated membrane protein [Microbacterium sp. SORGH_AS_0888]MDQ1128500.1 putative membrane protein (TIGR02234 family) [Microbacterium sp. SORGH_AS_0888]